MKVDRTILTNNDQQLGQIADPDKLESSIKHLADVTDFNDDAKTDKTGDHNGTWKGLTPGEAAEPINGARLDAIEPKIPTFIVGNGERVEIIEVTFSPNGSSNSVSSSATFTSAFSSAPSITPLNIVSQNVSYSDRLLYPFMHSITTTGFSALLKADGTNLLGAGTLVMKFMVVGK